MPETDAPQQLDLSELKADAERLEAAIAAAEAGEPDAEAKLAEAIGAIVDCAEGGAEPQGEGPGGEEIEQVPEGAGEAEAEPVQSFAPQQDKFHGYGADQEQSFTGDSTMPDTFDSEQAGKLFAANPQAAFAGMFELVANQGKMVRDLCDGMNHLVKRNQETDQSRQFSAARSEFQAFLASDELKDRVFDAAGALATFDACKGDQNVTTSLKRMLANSPKKTQITPADFGQAFDAETANFSAMETGTMPGGSARNRPLTDREAAFAMPSLNDDPKAAAFVNAMAKRGQKK